MMNERAINKDYLLLLVKKNNLVTSETLTIEKNFIEEEKQLAEICNGFNDNIVEITNYIKTELKSKLPDKTINYCQELDKPYQSIYINIEQEIKSILDKRTSIFAKNKSNKEDKEKGKTPQTIVDFFSKKNYVEVGTKIKENQSGDLYVTFFDSKNSPNDVFLTKFTSKYYNEGQPIEKGFFDDLEIINVPNLLGSVLYINPMLAKYGEEKLKENIKKLKQEILQKIKFWFEIFDIEFAYEKAKRNPKVLAYSHRISGWSNPIHRITENLRQQVKTNFGYGNSSYFYVILEYKGIQITPFSEWINYEFRQFSEVIRYTKSFTTRIPKFNKFNRLWYYKIMINNSYWHSAIEFTKEATNLSLTNEEKFIKDYIIKECEAMVNGLEKFYTETKHNFIEENKEYHLNTKTKHYNKNFQGFELIDFTTEKIIGSLDFINKLLEYDKIIPTKKYINKIYSLCNKFIPKVYSALDNEKKELQNTQNKLKNFMVDYNQILAKKKFYENEKIKLKTDFRIYHQKEYLEFIDLLTQETKKLNEIQHKIKLHTDNTERLSFYINKYNNIVGSKLTWDFLFNHKQFFNAFFSTFHSFSKEELSKYYRKLAIGYEFSKPSPSTGEPLSVGKANFGLIYNKNIRWTPDLQKIYSERELLDFYYIKSFDNLPLDIKTQVDYHCGYEIEFQTYWSLGNGEYLPSEIFEKRFKEIKIEHTKKYNKIMTQKTFSNLELLDIITDFKDDYFCNNHFTKSLTNKIYNDIEDFSLGKFYSKLPLL